MTNRTSLFIAGAAAGAVVGLLYAPTTGQRTRGKIGKALGIKPGQGLGALIGRELETAGQGSSSRGGHRRRKHGRFHA